MRHDRHDMTLAVKVALNPNTTNQPIFFSATTTTSTTTTTTSIATSTTITTTTTTNYFMLSGRISKNISENVLRSNTGTTSENTDFHVLVA